MIISIHAPTNGATVPPRGRISSIYYFNPRSDERSDCYSARLHLPCCNFNPCSDERSDVSGQALMSALQNFNPRSDERSDDVSGTEDDRSCNFNPRSDERSDVHTRITSNNPAISIHAPTNGATYKLVATATPSPFQSTLRRTERPRNFLQFV